LSVGAGRDGTATISVPRASAAAKGRSSSGRLRHASRSGNDESATIAMTARASQRSRLP
jgi:hypothetical protein